MKIDALLCVAVACAGLALVSLDVSADTPVGDFEALKSLEGQWVAVGPDGAPTEQVVSSWKATAGGSAIVETLFPGAAHEMVTVYHKDGDGLVLTHYCASGNQPRMKVTRTAERRLSFECQGGTNIPSEDVPHMHAGWIEWVDADHYKSEWANLDHGRVTHTAKFDLVRRKE